MSSTTTRKRKRIDVAETSHFGATPGLDGAPQPLRERRQEEEGHSQGQRNGTGYWSNCAAQDNARVQYGHTYVQNHYNDGRRDITQEDKVEVFIKALKFAHMDSRYDSIDPAHINTCRWLFQKQQYLQWRDPRCFHQHHGFLWIKGKAGTGKSTLMKCALEHAKDAYNPDSVIAFFFNARGHDLRRSAEGMYRSLLCQVLVQFPGIRGKFTTTIPQDIEQQTWSIPALRNLFHKAVSLLESGEAMTVYVDALDECDEDDIREAVEHFEELGTIAQSRGFCLHLCFASRYYPQITIPHCVEIELEAQVEHQQDIDTYINNKLSIRDPVLHSRIAYGIRQRCSGIFFWVVLVIRMLKRKNDRGACNSEMLHTLSEIPLRLQELIAEILEAPDDILVITMRWMLLAGDGLSLPALYFAIRTGAGQLKSGVWDRTEVDLKAMESFVLASSRGLVEVNPRPQLIHESVQEFLLAGGLASIEGCGFTIQKTLARSHEKISQWCQAYVRLDQETYLTLSESDTGRYENDDDWESAIHERSHSALVSKYPLLSYSINYIFHHLLGAHDGEELDLYSLRDFPYACWAHLFPLQRFPNRWAWRNDTALHHDPTALLCLLTLWRCDGLLVAILRADVALSSHGEKPLGADERARRVFADRLDLNARVFGELGTLLELAVLVDSHGIVEALLLHGADANARCGEALRTFGPAPETRGEETALALAVRHGHLSIVKLLLARGADPNGSNDGFVANPLLRALGHYFDGWPDPCTFHMLLETRKRWRMKTKLPFINALLDHGAEVSRDVVGGLTPLKYAAGNHKPAVVRLLLEREQQNDDLVAQLLVHAVKSRNVKVVQLLLERFLHAEARSLAVTHALQFMSDTWTHWSNSGSKREPCLSIFRLLWDASSSIIIDEDYESSTAFLAMTLAVEVVTDS